MPHVPQRASKILVVEDDLDTRELLVEFFQSHGYEVTAVATAEEGLDELRCKATDIVLSDNQLEGSQSGSWMMRRAYEQGLLQRVAAVMYTADDDLQIPLVVRVIHKPAGFTELERIAESAIDSARRVPLPALHNGDDVPSSRVS